MALVSPGVEVIVIDESFYTPASPGTVPMIFVASAENKPNSNNNGVARGTLKSEAGKPKLLTSQRELVELFGDPLFYEDNNGNMIHGSELNEYGLQTAYSLLGVTSRVFVTRADIDLAKLKPSAFPPGGKPADGTYWFDTQVTDFGLLEWNAAPVTTTGGQSFSLILPITITETADIEELSGGPLESIGGVGDYAIDATTTMNRVWYKNTSGTWVEVGSDDWKASWPAVKGTKANPTLTTGQTIVINEQTVTLNGSNIEALASNINAITGTSGVTAKAVDGYLELYVTSQAASDGVNPDGLLSIRAGTGTLLTDIGITATTAPGVGGTRYAPPSLSIGPHTEVPRFKNTDVIKADSSDEDLIDDSIEPVAGFSAYPTGSLWLKTTSPNGGASFSVKRWNAETELWDRQFAPIYESNEEAIYNLDRSGGGANFNIGDLYVKSNVDEATPPIANYKIYRRVARGATVISSKKIVAGTLQLGSSNNEFTMAETLINNPNFTNAKTISFTSTGSSTDAQALAAAVNGAGFVNIRAQVTSQNRVEISHKTGGEIRIVDTDGTLTEMGFIPFSPTSAGTTANLYYTPGTDESTLPANYTASNWRVLNYIASDDEPLELPPDGELWYSSVIDEVDILHHNGDDWVGYRDSTAFPDTDPVGPSVGASPPTAQSDGTPLVDNDIWIDTSDIENYPLIYRWNSTLEEWIPTDKTDQTTENGIVFADARWSDDGSNDQQADIADLLLSNYKDPDAPDPNLYPRGMLLWNLRRSGFNVKRFRRNYINLAQDNIRFPVETNSQTGEDFYSLKGDDQAMENYYPHRWVTDSGNNQDGSGTFGRHAQRKTVVQALQAMVNKNQDIRDEESRFFNLMACPGYPELIGEMVTLNYDRRLTAFIVGDTPARLTPDATSLNEWATNVRLAVEDNDRGAVSFDEYLAMYYPWGFTSDNAGNNVVVPPSHMALRTMVLNDQVAYPWFAPAGTRRGGVTNATSSGYINREGEFVPISLNNGQRDVLYLNNINPITFLTGAGLVVYGQKTRARNASALDRINVARLIVYMRVQLERLAKPYLFEPNDKITRDQVKAAAEAFCLELVSLRALYDFLVVCDETNNTPARIDRNELWLDIAIEPVKAIEFIYIPLRIKNTGEIASL